MQGYINMKYRGPDIQLANLDLAPLGFRELLLSVKIQIRFDRGWSTGFVARRCLRGHIG